jgi:hypothetical protein
MPPRDDACVPAAPDAEVDGMTRSLVAVCVVTLGVASAAAQPSTPSEIEAFMRAAKVVRQRELSTGITRPLRLTLTDGASTHDAVFQAIDEKRAVFQPRQGPGEVNFVDSWRYNVAAYRLATAIGLGAMMPVTIEYAYRGRQGALSWFMDSIMDERKRLKEKIRPPDVAAWNRDMYRMRIFTSLVHDTDRNLGNVLISPAWRVIMVDFTRAFRLRAEIASTDIHQCERGLFAGLQSLTSESLAQAVTGYLTPGEQHAVMKRRDLILAHIRVLIAERGEDKVLY